MLHRLVLTALATASLAASAATPGSAHAGRFLGISPEQAPAAPTATEPTMSISERRKAVIEGDLPEFLLPVTYPDGGLHFSRRWYDDRGQVYRSREVAIVLRSVGNPNVDHHLKWRQVFVAASATPFLAGTPLLLAGDQLALGVENYNYQRAQDIRATATAGQSTGTSGVPASAPSVAMP
jgi:hypothetical protein